MILSVFGTEACGSASGKIFRNFLGDLAGCGPFGATEKKSLEAYALHCRVVFQIFTGVSDCQMENSCIAVIHREYEGLLTA